ncbi:MAG: hypothetical protein GY850_22920 [bacterium]|nr:hypothetical protein [bacterium]
MPEITIVNTSPLFYFHRLGILELFNKLLDLDFRLKPNLVKAILEIAGEK